MERTFAIAYGVDDMSMETRETFVNGQLQEGLSYQIMKAPAVSGAQLYRELVMAAKNEERRQVELKKRQEYSKGMVKSTTQPKRMLELPRHNTTQNRQLFRKQNDEGPRCYKCGKFGHLQKQCRAPKIKSGGRQQWKPNPTRRILTGRNFNPEDFLDSNSSDSEENPDVRQVRVNDEGSQPRCAKVQVQGIPMCGIVDTGADITIIGGMMFKRVATAIKLKKRDFRKSDRTARNYDGQPFQLDGVMDLDITFDDKTIRTSVYIKMNAHDELLLSEGVCRQLGIVHYHPDIQKWNGGRKKRAEHQKIKTHCKNEWVILTLI